MRRRRVLRSAAGLAGLGVLGSGTAGPEVHAEGLDRYMVGTSGPAHAREVASQAASLRHVVDLDGYGTVVAGRFTAGALADVRQHQGTKYVEPDLALEPDSQTVESDYDAIDANEVRADGFTGEGADVAVLDTGVDMDHPDLRANLEQNLNVEICGPVINVCEDEEGVFNAHGTHVAGIIGAVDNDEGVVGVAPGATLHSIQFENIDSDLASDLVAALGYVEDQGWDVANISHGIPYYEHSEGLKEATKSAYKENGVLLVASAGNFDTCYEDPDCSTVKEPAAFDYVVGVSNFDTSDGALYDGDNPSATGPEIELTAPGVDILSTLPDGDYGRATGTSMAAPMVAGAGAILMANGFSASEARSRLRTTATWDDDWGDPPTDEYGHGLLNVENAVTALAPTVRTYSIRTDGTDAELGLYLERCTADYARVWFTYWQANAEDPTYMTTEKITVLEEGYYTQDVTDLEYYRQYGFRAHVRTFRGNSDSGDAGYFWIP